MLVCELHYRLRSCEGAYRLLESYGKTYQTEVKYIDEAYSQLNNVPLSKLNVEPTKVCISLFIVVVIKSLFICVFFGFSPSLFTKWFI